MQSTQENKRQNGTAKKKSRAEKRKIKRDVNKDVKKMVNPDWRLEQAQLRARTLSLSPCSRLYLKCLTNPFDVTIKGACVPDLNAVPSVKLTFKARGYLQTGTVGTGFLMFNPWYVPNDQACIEFTNPTFAGDGFDRSVVGALTDAYMTQCPYGYADTVEGGGKLAYRVVGAGCRIRYTGAELYKSGQIIPMRHPDNVAISGLTDAQLLNFNEILTYPVDRDRWHEMAWAPTPLTYNAVQYGGYEYVGGLTTGFAPVSQANTIGISIANSAFGPSIPTPTYEWECIGHYEWVGGTFDTTPSHSDLTGISAIRNVQGGSMAPSASPAVFNKALKQVEAAPAIDWMSMVTTGAKIAGTAAALFL